jgi:hypothetical protein
MTDNVSDHATPGGQDSWIPRCCSIRSTRLSRSASNSLSVGTPRLEATASRSRARSSVVIPGEASATSDRSPAVLVGRRTTSASVAPSTSGCSSSEMGPDDIAMLTLLVASALASYRRPCQVSPSLAPRCSRRGSRRGGGSVRGSGLLPPGGTAGSMGPCSRWLRSRLGFPISDL